MMMLAKRTMALSAFMIRNDLFDVLGLGINFGHVVVGADMDHAGAQAGPSR